MAESKLFIRHRKEARREARCVRLAFTTNMASAPAWVDEFPEPIIYSDGIPGVSHGLWRYGITRPEGRKTETFAVAADDDRFKTSFCG